MYTYIYTCKLRMLTFGGFLRNTDAKAIPIAIAIAFASVIL